MSEPTRECTKCRKEYPLKYKAKDSCYCPECRTEYKRQYRLTHTSAFMVGATKEYSEDVKYCTIWGDAGLYM